MAFTDNFNRADSSTVGNNWIESVDARWSILNNKLRASGGGDMLTNQLWRPTSENFANGFAEVEWKRSASDQVAQIHARKQAGVQTFYIAWIQYGNFFISKVVSGTRTEIATKTGLSINQTDTYKLKFTLSGTSLVARLDNVTASSFVWELTVTDSAISASGQHGLSISAGTATIDYDNFSSGLTIDATKSVADDGAGLDNISVTDTSGVKTPSDSGSGTEAIGINAYAPVQDAGQGQDSISVTVFLNITETGAGADYPSIIEPAMLGLLERFDGTLANWTLDQSGGTAQIQTVNNDEKLILNDTSTSALICATRAIEGQSAPFCIEADIYVGAGAIGLIEALDSGDNILFSMKADAVAGQGTFDTDYDAASTFTLTANKYYQIVFYCNTLNDTVKAWYITGAGSTPSVWTAISAAKSYTGGLVSKIRLTTDTVANGEARFDEIKVFRPNVFCIGDSNTAGYAASTAYWNPSPDSAQRLGAGENETHSYPYWLGLKFSPGQLAANRGLNSDQSSDVDGRIQSDVIDQGAETVVILIGTNDITAGVALATIEANIESAANKAATAGLTVCLCSVPPNNSWNTTQNTKRNDLNAWIEGLCSSNGYRFADVYGAVKNPSDPDQIAPSVDSGDGLHFTTSGLQAIADTVYSALIETKSLTDVLSGFDSIEVRNLVALTEGVAASDNIDVLGLVAIAETGAGADAPAIFAAIQILELASTVEGLVAGGAPSAHAVSDSGSGCDSVVATIKEGATLQNIYDLTLTRLASLDYVVPDNAAITAVHSLLRGVEKWKNNKLACTAVSGTVETWVLFDDDGATPLLTWTHNLSTKTRSKAN